LHDNGCAILNYQVLLYLVVIGRLDFMGKIATIQPLFILSEHATQMGQKIINYRADDYNKAAGEALIAADNDADAIASFLGEYKSSPRTLTLYAKEVERLLLWCVHAKHCNISSLRRDDLLSYLDFLKNPTPKKLWCGKSAARLKKDGSLNPRWRPFIQGLSGSTINKIIKILDSFFNYLVQTNYLVGNPLAIDKKRKRRNANKNTLIERYLERDEIQAVVNRLLDEPIGQDERDKRFKFQRARYMVLLLFYTGLRIREAEEHTMGHFIQRESNWFLRVTGKGKKTREIPAPDALMQALADFRSAVGLPSPAPKYREKTPLVPMQNIKQPVSVRRIDQIMRWAFNLAAIQFDADAPQKASKLRAASAHWLRHSYVTYLLESGAPLKVAQENAGHSNVATTMHYRHVAQTDRHAATRTLSLTANNKDKDIS